MTETISPYLEYSPEQNFRDYFNMDVPTEAMNATTEYSDVVPVPEQGFVVGVYSALLVIGAVGNVSMMASLVKSRRSKSRVNLLMTHLVVADLIVTFIVIPLEIGWRTTNAWLAGNLACKFFLVLRAFGLYLSSNVLVCISVDRYYAILHPLRLPVARKRSKTMLCLAWMFALLCSLPQSFVFRVMHHPKVPEFEQCVSFEAFANQSQELAYNVFCLCAMYFMPLLIISVCYMCIFYEIFKNSKQNFDGSDESSHSRVMLRRSDQRPLARARRRTLRMTVTIVTVFACCWLPYATMTLWYMIDRKSAMHVSPKVQDLFFVMAVSNSCMDPLVYGSYSMDPRTFTNIIRKIFCIHSRTSDVPGINDRALIKSKLDTDTNEQDNMRTYGRHHQVHFKDISKTRICVNSEPVMFTTIDAKPITPSLSCDVFALPSPRRWFVS